MFRRLIVAADLSAASNALSSQETDSMALPYASGNPKVAFVCVHNFCRSL